MDNLSKSAYVFDWLGSQDGDDKLKTSKASANSASQKARSPGSPLKQAPPSAKASFPRSQQLDSVDKFSSSSTNHNNTPPQEEPTITMSRGMAFVTGQLNSRQLVMEWSSEREEKKKIAAAKKRADALKKERKQKAALKGLSYVSGMDVEKLILREATRKVDKLGKNEKSNVSALDADAESDCTSCKGLSEEERTAKRAKSGSGGSSRGQVGDKDKTFEKNSDKNASDGEKLCSTAETIGSARKARRKMHSSLDQWRNVDGKISIL